MSIATPIDPGARKNLNRGWISLIVMVLGFFGAFFFGEGVFAGVRQGQPLNLTGMAMAIVMGLLLAVGAILAVLFGIRAYKAGNYKGLIPIIGGAAGGLIAILALVQVIVGLVTGNWF